MSKGDNTRSGLLWEVERLLNECNELPHVLMMENVTQIHGKKHNDDFEKWKSFLEQKGYRNFCKDLYAKDFGIPQNRKRTFMISILGDCDYEFPEPIELNKELKDLLQDESEVDEKYFLSDSMVEFYIHNDKVQREKGNGFRFTPKTRESSVVARTITTKSGSRMEDDYVKEKRDIT